VSDALQLLERLMDLVRSAGPGAFFLAMILLPAIGVPMLAFLLPVVALFGDELGLATVMAIALACLTANMALTHALARRGLRPVLTRLVTRFGYKLPDINAGDITDLIILLRVTPGIPFSVQNYLAGIADAPFGRYMLVSCIIVWPLNVAIMLFGDSLLQGKSKAAIITLGVLAAFAAARLLLRRHYAAKDPGA
jgi:uncharacterized membrane protein YdjX (TVP38/TMEM64 family)